MLRWLVLSAAFLAVPAHAQDKAQTLADIKTELGQLMAEFNALKAETVASGASGVTLGGGDTLQRLDTIEAELMRLTSRAEEIELRLNRVVTDGTNRIGDMEYRLCEVTEGCDPANLPETPTLGGDAGAAPAPVEPVIGAEPAPAGEAGPELAMGEQADFDRAKEVLGTGDFRTAADLFATFAQSYPGGPLSQEAAFLRGEALGQLGDKAGAARAYLDAFSGKPDGNFAAESLLKLGQALGDLGQVPDACVTLAEVPNRFPGTIHATNADLARQGLGCQ
ncbi:tol-pal system protein YbgF [Tabrizicola oligotrophica]|uniref:Cell division coordinator CpoB n=1 Tax=Tabrizicola oligotrophica TaxID=2710650 RepID=A0A6M0QVH3_9RHOB|nr:tol-pal system protein YbgF [Tabrizicola oligotrophica]